VVDCGAVGGGRMGSNIAHENEAPFPLRVPDLFIRSFCPPAGKVWDPFCGSGTTIEAAVRAGRHFVGTDLRLSQVRLTERRVRQARNRKGFGL
jgi:DNA modification methylase